MDGATKRILVVDDEPALLKMMQVYLRRLGHPVLPCTNTASAIREFEAAPDEFAVAVLDGSMAGPGFEQLAWQFLHASRQLCVIVASGYPLDITAVEALAPGRAMFLQKPFTSDMLTAAVRRMLAAQDQTETV
jgi:DNA-binding NtrC family response regulator